MEDTRDLLGDHREERARLSALGDQGRNPPQRRLLLRKPARLYSLARVRVGHGLSP
jgi:hypothetical protein